MNATADPTSVFDDELPCSPLALIDGAVDAAKAAGHACRDDGAREHIDFALAFLRESWLAESGQEARTPDQMIADKRWVSRLFAAVCGEGEGR